jgi:hypothetical protein
MTQPPSCSIALNSRNGAFFPARAPQQQRMGQRVAGNPPTKKFVPWSRTMGIDQPKQKPPPLTIRRAARPAGNRPRRG